MKKLMIGAAVAAISVGAFASACSATPGVCRAWDVKMSLKSLGPKKIKCTIAPQDPCDDSTTESVYYMDDVTRKLNGYLWICDYQCGNPFNVVLWDSKNKKAVIAAPRDGNDPYQEVDAQDVYVYGKKATKVAGTIPFAGMDEEGEPAIEVTASGINGKFVRGSEDDDCYIKSLSGHVTGVIAYIKPSDSVVQEKQTLCDAPAASTCSADPVMLLEFCDACCFDGWCAANDAPDMVPAVGTWSMKYNKKVSKGTKSIQTLVPGYAL